MTPLPRNAIAVALKLLAWFRGHARDLPWRKTRDPYAIWISEVMLQQTQVKTVIPYWTRWMTELPSVQALAAVREERLLKLWEGLGYYRRARNLQAAAREIVQKRNGRLPTVTSDWLSLPGIGEYTAGAIMSIAHNHPVAAVDGNVARVLTRLDGIARQPQTSVEPTTVRRRATQLVQAAERSPRSDASTASGPCSELNQALMELGATICTPKNPACAQCPVESLCRTKGVGPPNRSPDPSKRYAIVQRRKVVVVAEFRGRFLVRRCGDDSHNAGLWEFPSSPLRSSSLRAQTDAIGSLVDAVPKRQYLGAITHTITRYRIRLEVWAVPFSRKPAHIPGAWVTARQLNSRPFSAAHRRIIRQWLR